MRNRIDIWWFVYMRLYTNAHHVTIYLYVWTWKKARNYICSLFATPYQCYNIHTYMFIISGWHAHIYIANRQIYPLCVFSPKVTYSAHVAEVWARGRIYDMAYSWVSYITSAKSICSLYKHCIGTSINIYRSIRYPYTCMKYWTYFTTIICFIHVCMCKWMEITKPHRYPHSTT